MTDHDTLKAIHDADQRSQSEKDRDRALMRGVALTSAYYLAMKANGLPDHLAERLTVQFQEAYLNALLAPAYSFLIGVEDGDE